MDFEKTDRLVYRIVEALLDQDELTISNQLIAIVEIVKAYQHFREDEEADALYGEA